MKIYYSKLAPGFYINGISNIPDDAQEMSSELWKELLEGQSGGKSIDFTTEPPSLIALEETAQDEIAKAEAIKAQLRLIADTAIIPLEDAVDLGLATDDEISSRNDWRKFRVLLNRVDTSAAPDIEWPVKPE